MIIVIADDFTGAAEMAGICLNYGLKISLHIGEMIEKETDVVIVSTDSRSMNKKAALDMVSTITRTAATMKPDWLYKKIDSVLRGYVADEIEVQLKMLGLQKCLMVPANPTLGRTISNGRYFINGVEISKTAFARDPEFAVQSPDVKDMLGNPGINILKKGSVIQNGLNIAEAQSAEEVADWAGRISDDCLPAGSGDFFDALLGRTCNRVEALPLPEIKTPHLYICGTAFAKSRTVFQRVNSDYVAFITGNMTGTGDIHNSWLKLAESILNRHQKLMIAFDDTVDTCGLDAARLRTIMAAFVKEAVRRFRFKEILIEGGATAATVFSVLGIHHFVPVYEWSRGVLQMKTESLNIMVKPGSYDMPEAVKSLYNI